MHSYIDTSGTPTRTTNGVMSTDDSDSSTSVAIGVTVSVVGPCTILVLVVIAAVIVHRHKNQGDAAIQGSSANGMARPSALALLQHSGNDAYTCTTATPQPMDGAPPLYGNGNGNVNHRGDDEADGPDEQDEQPVDADCFGPEAADSAAVDVVLFN